MLVLLLLLQISSSVRNTVEHTGNVVQIWAGRNFLILVSSSSESGSGLIGSGVGGLIGGGKVAVGVVYSLCREIHCICTACHRSSREQPQIGMDCCCITRIVLGMVPARAPAPGPKRI